MSNSTSTTASTSNNNNSSNTSVSSTSALSSTTSYFWQWDIEAVEKWLTKSVPAPPKVDVQTHNQRISTLIKSISSVLTSNPNDIYSILPSNIARGDSVQHTAGSILSRLPLLNIINAIYLKENGGNPEDLKGVPDEIKNYAMYLVRTISSQVEIDMMESTPARIVEILCPEVTMPEINAIRKRIYDTVILGRGTNSSATAQSLEEDDTTTTKSKSYNSIVEQYQKCQSCGNNDQSLFTIDKKNGDVICMNCGTVVASSLMHEGSQFRKFEGEADRNHHGDTPNPLFSNAHNMSTTLGGVNLTATDRMVGGGKKRTMETVLRNAHAYTEMNISQFYSHEKKTRIGYKDKQKKEAFSKMHHVGDALSLHEAVIQRAKELFSGFRDDRELVQQFKGVVAACLCESYHQLSQEGRRILKKNTVEEEKDMVLLAKRANWRNDMHRSTAASQEEIGKEIVSKARERSELERVPVSAWDMGQCRLFLLETCKKIAELWSSSLGNTTHVPYPNKTRDELEGMLIEYTLVTCDYIEQTLKKSNKVQKVGNKRRVVTPRAKDMSHLTITWQHSDPVRNGMTKFSHEKTFVTDGKTAGQVLLLLTTKKWSSIINDTTAGEAFHKELKAMLALQESHRVNDRRKHMANNRFKQLKRKPWLQLRAQQDS